MNSISWKYFSTDNQYPDKKARNEAGVKVILSDLSFTKKSEKLLKIYRPVGKDVYKKFKKFFSYEQEGELLAIYFDAIEYAIKKYDNNNPKANLGSLIYMKMYNLCIDRYKKNKRYVEFQDKLLNVFIRFAHDRNYREEAAHEDCNLRDEWIPMDERDLT